MVKIAESGSTAMTSNLNILSIARLSCSKITVFYILASPWISLFRVISCSKLYAPSPSALDLCLDPTFHIIHLVWYMLILSLIGAIHLTVLRYFVGNVDYVARKRPTQISFTGWKDCIHIWYWRRHSETTIYCWLCGHRHGFLPLPMHRASTQAFRQVRERARSMLALLTISMIGFCLTCGNESLCFHVLQFLAHLSVD